MSVTQVPTSTTPTTEQTRIDSLDTMRGVAVLGILLMNIVGFGLPHAYEDPTVYGGHTGPDFGVWLATSLFFEGTMRGLFTLLFGAGVVLFTSRAEATRPGDAADLHVRRMLWLILFGFVNSHLLLWRGDILYEYGITGLVLYAFRRTAPQKLVVIAILLLAALTVRGAIDYHGLTTLQATAIAADEAAGSGQALTPAQIQARDDWREELADAQPSGEKLQKEIDAIRGGFASAFAVVTEDVFEWRTSFFYEYGFLEDLATMMLGMALFMTGALQGRWSGRQYLWLMLGGYGVGVSVNAYEAWAVVDSNFDPVVNSFNWLVTYELGRVPTTLGHVGLIMLAWKSGVFAGLMRRLAATGRMAFTNYLMQSLIGMLLFTGVGFGLFGQLARHELYYVVAAIWLLQLLWSPWWLARHHYGPLEWLWRALTYRQRPPLRRT
jgi:uncharacterized protein